MRRRFSYANVAATLALVFSMSGGALAANHYLINSTKQIKPSVLKKLKGDIAGFSVTLPGEVSITHDTASYKPIGLSLAIPPGSFIVAGNLALQAMTTSGSGATESACELLDGSHQLQYGAWSPAIPAATAQAAGDIPFNVAVSESAPSTLSVDCVIFFFDGTGLAIHALTGSITAVQTSHNN